MPCEKEMQNSYECVINEDDSTQITPDIFKIILSGDASSLQNLIRRDPSCLSSVDATSSRPIHYAASNGQIQMIHLIVNVTGLAEINAKDEKGNTPLHSAVEKDRFESCKTLLELGADPNILNSFLMSPLHMAISLRHNQIIELLVSQNNTDLNLDGDLGNSPVILACSTDNHEALSTLLQYGARLCSQNKLGHFAVHAAAFAGSKKCLEKVLKKGEELGYSFEHHLNFIDKSCSSPLHLAVHGGNIEVIKFCIDNGAKVDLQQNDKSTALHFACSQGAIDVVKLMLSSCKQEDNVINIIDGGHQTPLHKAVIFDHIELVQYLVSKGAGIDSIDCECHTPLLLATSCGAWKSVEFLVLKGANVKKKDSAGCNFLHLAIQQPKGLKNLSDSILQRKEVMTLLDDKDNEGCSPLHYACKLGVPDSVNNMLGLKVSISLKSKDKKSPLHFAAAFGRINTCQRLLERMKDTRLLNEGDEKGMTPLHLAAQNGHTRVVEILLRKGALFLCDHKGWTCFHYAAEEGYTQTMKILLETNIKLMDKADEDGNTALHLAAREGHAAAVALLLDKGAEINLNKSEGSFLHEAIYRGRKEVAFVAIESERSHETLTTYKPGSVKKVPVLDMIEHLPEAAKMLLDKAIKESDDDVNCENYHIIYNFKYLQCPLSYKKLAEEDKKYTYHPLAAMNTMVRFKRVDLLTHPVCKKYLQMKWIAYGLKAHVLNLVIYTFGLLPLTTLIVKMRPKTNYTTEDKLSINNDLKDKENYLLTVCMILVLIMSLYAVGKEIVQIFQQRCRYFFDYSNGLDWAAAITSLLFVLPMLFNVKDTWHWQFGAVAIFISWLNYLLYMQRFENFGIYVVMFGEILRTLIRIVLVFFFLILAFALSFYALMIEQRNYRTIPVSVMQTFAMMLGEISYQDNFLVPFLNGRMAFPPLTFIALVWFLLLVPILLMNLLIGLAVGDIAEVQRNACLKRIAMQVDLHTSLEEKLPYWFMRRVDQDTVTVYPNKVCGSKMPFFFNLNASSDLLPKLESGDCASPIEFELKKQKFRLKDISNILQKQHNLLKLIIEKMEIVSEADEQDDPDLFSYGNVKRQHLLNKKSKWDCVIKAVHAKKE
ncbi:transient receptor potential cation channel subfamily A member 1b [Erpetoichthys calabaricus]|uniref:transient receptor potential cation channel subfamily A member 1b n=1 Tax=Erpetoichthys calabaricus TaxID=27687 RepID=UPI0022341952|nr:transient receptor potential cation channel subfamily A member 1b [Erpetoichthys calabaricus]